ncbi:hypothetical protein [Halomonas rhizosphaerae]|uniref:DUF3253 domain-containing protein n=1 Tax=Halomonas rhizosphaerae TaxID=3043296 RepID=A0ABT6V036_9GAMM|nr:hypothetical protein [Halomonas rhizosphaerae]MDI5890629.1 hypothetical protein [Halomonas rhizosphaerae]
MKPIDLENAILIALRRCGGQAGSDGATVGRLHRLLAQGYAKTPSWRDVATTVIRLGRMGLVRLVGEETIGEDCHPLYALSPAGVRAAHTARIQQHNAGVLNEEVDHGCA